MKLGCGASSLGGSVSRLQSLHSSMGSSQLDASMLEQFMTGDANELKVLINEHIVKRLKVQRRVFDTQLKNLRILAMQEAKDFIKSKSAEI